MTTTIEPGVGPLVDPTAPAWEPPNRHLLTERHPAMITHLVERYGVRRDLAEPAVVHLWDRLVARLPRKDHEFRHLLGHHDEPTQRRYSERIVDQTIALVYGLGTLRDRAPLAPSELVDVGWHAWKLYSLETEAFEHAWFGRPVHHHPADVPGYDYSRAGTDLVQRTITALGELGLVIDTELWSVGGDCESGARCDNHGSGGSSSISFFTG